MDTITAILAFIVFTVGPYAALAAAFVAVASLFTWAWREMNSANSKKTNKTPPLDNPPNYHP